MMKEITRLLELNHTYSPRYKNGLSNHLSMALIALFLLGTTDEQLQKFFGSYSERLEPLNLAKVASDDEAQSSAASQMSKNKISRENYFLFLGKFENFLGYCDFFNAELERLGFKSLLKEYLPKLMPGVGAEAFHPLIRLSYALNLHAYAEKQGGDDSDDLCAVAVKEVVMSLAYWADGYLPLPVLEKSAPLSELHDKMLRLEEKGVKKAHLISTQMELASVLPAYRELALNLSQQNDLYSELLKAISFLFVNYPSFTVLHAFTSTQALGILLPFFDNQLEALQHHWRAIVAAYLTVPCQNQFDKSSIEVMSWVEIKAQARQNYDAHHIKVTYSALTAASFFQLDDEYDTDYRLLASREFAK